MARTAKGAAWVAMDGRARGGGEMMALSGEGGGGARTRPFNFKAPMDGGFRERGTASGGGTANGGGAASQGM